LAPIAFRPPGPDDRCMSQLAIPDIESLGWHRALNGTGAGRQHAVERLHALLLRAARFEVARRRRTVDEDLDALAVQAADEALRAILSRLHTYRGDARFTTWAYKFALHEAAAKVRERRGLASA
jgi:RNA polymerase sigma-70 factor (ECF subfamily)